MGREKEMVKWMLTQGLTLGVGINKNGVKGLLFLWLGCGKGEMGQRRMGLGDLVDCIFG